MFYLIPIIVGVGAFLVGCAGKKPESPDEKAPVGEKPQSTPAAPPKKPPPDFNKTLRGIPPHFFAKDATQISNQLLEAIERKTKACVGQWGADLYNDCKVFTAASLAPENPHLLDPTQIRIWAKEELARFYEQYLKSPLDQRVLGKYFILVQGLEKILLTSQFGTPLNGNEFEQILAKVREKTGLIHVPPRRKAISWKEIDASHEPIEVHIQDIPIEMQKMARKIKLSKEMANQLGIPGDKTLWDFIVKNTDTVIFAKHIPSPHPNNPMLAEAKTLFFKEVFLNVNGSKNLLGTDFLAGLISSLAHESYHNFFHHQLKGKNEQYVNAYILEERNGYLLQSEVSIQRIWEDRKKGLDKTRLIEMVYEMANGLVVGLAANYCLGYQPYDRSLRTDISPDLNKRILSIHPIACLQPYLASQGINQGELFNKLMEQLGLSEYKTE